MVEHKPRPMATSQTASSGSGTAAAKAIGETIVGSHMMKIEGFPGTKDLGVGKSIKSSTFNVGGHGWYMECYPCGVDEESAGWVSLFVCLSDHKEQVEAECCFTLTMSYDVGYGGLREVLELHGHDIVYKSTLNADTLWRCGETDLIQRGYLESVLKDDGLQIRCDVAILTEFPAVPPPDLHRPLIDLVASGMPGDVTFQVGGQHFTVHRTPGPSAHVAASPTSAAGRIASGSHVLTIDGYSKTKKMFPPSHSVESDCFVVGGRRWFILFYPSEQELDEDNTGCLAFFLHNCADEDEDKNERKDEDEVLKVRFELTLLTFAREIISSAQFCYAFTSNDRCRCYFPFNMETEPLLGDSFHVNCDLNVVKEITPMRPPDLHLHFGHLLASQVATDVTFEVAGDLFSAHKLVLATRSMAFMANFFGPTENGSSTTVTRVQIDDMEPRVFKALLHFIYTDALPEVHEEDDKVAMAQGLLVAADRYAMERLKLICGDMLCCYINDARTAITTLDLADKHGCPRLREACKKFLMDNIA